MEQIIENLEAKIFKKYTENLRKLNTNIKQKICFYFITIFFKFKFRLI
jgi:hypothetical protein